MATSDTAPASGSILVILLSILLPPLGVALSRGIGTQFLINILLTILGYVPGLVHAVWLAARPAP
ncbi:YqaE/Pmp3 family membrane protein [Henriciella mobilis]|uniref:YqaE/Pmp3 family membrane protein n=1 Tax=Henriciella mobilis TaxID=2305467 RepID=UPI000E6727A8|nr:YqaE/Pmp3 family membrane protein [Henriciella mobilis]RIJ16377.1 YqaE/Pmp3 family membrane protein [Henriciella mobilis]RIJ22501.1 YqaE/Pmp3 family membrane protein [Henriciella mobilis]